MPIQLRKLPRKNKTVQFLWQSDIHLQQLFRLNIARCYYVEDFITSLVLWEIMQILLFIFDSLQPTFVCTITFLIPTRNKKLLVLFLLKEMLFPIEKKYLKNSNSSYAPILACVLIYLIFARQTKGFLRRNVGSKNGISNRYVNSN